MNETVLQAGNPTRPSPRQHDAGRQTDDIWVADTLGRLSQSAFRSSYTLSAHDADYARRKGRDVIGRHAREMLAQRVGAAQPYKDGKQTPWRGHPVFTAQHATACCCRGCIERWHHIPRGRALSSEDINRLASLVMAWIDRDLARHPAPGAGTTGAGTPDAKHSGWEKSEEQTVKHGLSCKPSASGHPDGHGNHSGFIQGALL